MSNGEIIVYIGLLAGVMTILSPALKWIYNSIQAKKTHSKLPKLIEGIYVGYRSTVGTDNIIYELVYLSKYKNGFKGKPIYKHEIRFDYEMIGKFFKGHNIYEGTWKNLNEEFYHGSFQMIYDTESYQFKGFWIGPSKSEGLKSIGGKWILNHTKEAKFNWFSKNNQRRIRKNKRRENKNFEQRKGYKLLDDIIGKHSSSKVTEFNYENINLKLGEYDFNPNYGKISKKLLAIAIERYGKPENVLDLGCGSGFYSIYFAKNGSEKVIGLDISNKSIENAKYNQIVNNIDSRIIEFRKSDIHQLFSGLRANEKFDLIIANLPFTAREYCSDYASSPYYNLFAANENLIFNFIVGSQFHLKKKGRAIFASAKSGYIESLRYFGSLSNLEILKIYELPEKDDTYYIYEMELNKDILTEINERTIVLSNNILY